MAYVPFLAGWELTADRLNTRLIAETMEWTALTSIGSFAANFSASSDTPRMRKITILGVERWEFAGRITVSALTANTTTLMYTFNVGYRPATEHGWPMCGSNTAFYSVRGTISSAGLWNVGVPTAAGNNTSAIFLDGIYIDNPLSV